MAEFIIKTVLAIVGAALIAAGIVSIVRVTKTGSKVLGVVAISAGVVMWLIILLTTIVSSTTARDRSKEMEI